MTTTYGYGGGYTTTSYGGGGGMDGGGFMAGSQGGSQSSPGGKGYSKDSLRPVTIKQLIEAQQPQPDGEFMIDGSEINQVTFVGQIRSMGQQATNTTYKLDDGTGIIEVKQWLDSEAGPSPNQSKLHENAWCRVFGRMKSFNNKRHIGSHFIRPVSEYDEVSMHMLEATYVHCYFTKGSPESLAAGGASEGGMFVQQGEQSAGGAPSVGNMMKGLQPNSQKVLAYLNNSPNNNEGTNVHQIAKALNMDIANVFKAGDELLGGGIIYTTIDDETWAVLES